MVMAFCIYKLYKHAHILPGDSIGSTARLNKYFKIVSPWVKYVVISCALIMCIHSIIKIIRDLKSLNKFFSKIRDKLYEKSYNSHFILKQKF